MTKKIKPFPFQLEGIEAIQDFGGVALLADEMGLGKSCQAIRWWRKYTDKNLPILLICPAGLKWNWKDEIKKWAPKYTVVTLSTKTPFDYKPKKEAFYKKVYIINYDILKAWLPWLKKIPFSTVVMDECHLIKNRKSQRSKASKSISLKIPHRILLSGTPLTNMPADLWVALNILDRKGFPSFFAFCSEYAKPKKTPWGWTFKGAKNLGKLHRILKRSYMIRRLKKDVLKDLPDKVHTVVPIDLLPAQRKKYDKAKFDFLRWANKKQHTMSKSQFETVSKTKMMKLKTVVGKLKMNFLVEWIENFLEENDGKLIVFGIHKKVLKQLHDKFEKISVLVNGEVSMKDRKVRTKRFQKKENCRIFFGNIHAAGTGWNGSMANTVLFVELDWVPANMNQASDRPHRIGQKGNTSVYYLVARNTIEYTLCKMLQDKQGISDEVLDDKKNVKNLELHKQLLQKLLKEKK